MFVGNLEEDPAQSMVLHTCSEELGKRERNDTPLDPRDASLFLEFRNEVSEGAAYLPHHSVLSGGKSMNLIMSLSRGNSISKINFRCFGVIAH